MTTQLRVIEKIQPLDEEYEEIQEFVDQAANKARTLIIRDRENTQLSEIYNWLSMSSVRLTEIRREANKTDRKSVV